MALQLNLPTTNVGLPAPEAYARITGLNFNAMSGEVQVSVNVYANSQARDDGRSPVSSGVYQGVVGVDMPSLDDTIAGVRAVLYGWLKTLPDFTGALDV